MSIIRRKGLDKFEVQSKYLQEGLNLIVGFFFKHFLQFIQNSIKNIEKIIEDQNTELYKTFIVPFSKGSIKTKYVKDGLNMITQ